MFLFQIKATFMLLIFGALDTILWFHFGVIVNCRESVTNVILLGIQFDTLALISISKQISGRSVPFMTN